MDADRLVNHAGLGRGTYIHHMVQERNAALGTAHASAIQIDRYGYICFLGGALHSCRSDWRHSTHTRWIKNQPMQAPVHYVISYSKASQSPWQNLKFLDIQTAQFDIDGRSRRNTKLRAPFRLALQESSAAPVPSRRQLQRQARSTHG